MATQAQIDRDEVNSILSLYHLDGLEDFGALPAATAYRAYWLRVSGRRYVMTISPRRRFEDMVFDKELLLHLRRLGLGVPSVVENIARGSFTPWMRPGRYVSIYADLAGRRLGAFELRTRHARAVGDFLARVHRATDGFWAARPNPRGLPELVPLMDKAERALVKPRIEARYGEAIAALRVELTRQRRRRPRGRRGVVHGDLSPECARFERERLVGVLGFEAACTERYTVDLAAAISAWCWEPSAAQRGGPAGAFSLAKIRGMLAAYQDVRPLAPAERAELLDDLRAIALHGALQRFVRYELGHAERSSGGAFHDYRHPREKLAAIDDELGRRLFERALAEA